MKKDELIISVKSAIKTEEAATTIYLNHLTAITSRTNLPEEKIKKAKEIISTMINHNKIHKSILEKLLLRIEKEESDVF